MDCSYDQEVVGAPCGDLHAPRLLPNLQEDNLLLLPVAEVDRQDSLAGSLDSPHPGAAWGRATLLAVLAWHTRVAVR